MSNMEVIIKEITEKDIATSGDIVRRAFKTVADEFGLTKENASTNGAFLQDEKLLGEYQKGIKMFGLFESDIQVGFMALEAKDGETFYLEKLAVLPRHRHKGYGKALVDHAAQFVKAANSGVISIGIILENRQLCEWYRELGFVETGTKKFAHLPFTVCFMRLDV